MNSNIRGDSAAGKGNDEVSFLGVLACLVRRRGTIILITLVIVGATIAVTLVTPRRFSSHVSFMTDTGRDAGSQLFALAAQFGVAIPGERSSESPAFYADLLESDVILDSVVNVTYEFQAGNRYSRQNLIEVYQLNEDTHELNVAEAVERLREDVTVRMDRETGVVTLAVQAPAASLAKQIATKMVRLLNDFNLNTRQSRALAERRFIEDRVSAMRDELEESEDALQQFLQRNRTFRDSPHLTFEYDRLSRHVAMRQEVLTSLLQAFEQARIEEVRNTPVITVLEGPKEAVRADSRRLVLKSFLALVFGSLFGMAWTLSAEYLERARIAGVAEAQELSDLAGSIKRNARAVVRWLGRWRGN